MTEGISQSVQNSSCGYYYTQGPVVRASRASPPGGVSCEFIFF